MEEFQQLRRDSLEHATLLWSLTETPGDSCMYRDKATTQVFRQLSIVHERQLTDAFAFIASWKDDPDEIVAVCVEEKRPIDPGIVIRIASNTGNPSAIVAKLQCVAAMMKRASHRNVSRSELQQEMLSQIIAVCIDRILSRLRSCHARRTRRTANKPRLPVQLLETLERCVACKQPGPATRNVVQHAREFEKIFHSHETSLKEQDRKRALMGLLKCASSCDIPALRQVLSFKGDIDPTLRTHLPTAISKLARYVEISHYLINAAKTTRHSLFQDVELRAVTHPGFGPSHLVGPFRPFHELSTELGWQQQRSTSGMRTSRAQFESRLSNPTATWKVHAEIQIVMFYEMEPHSVKPRIISASKLACFCCDLFIRVHGEFVVPGTHGRIYNTWVLPDLPECDFRFYGRINPVMRRFISQLKLISTQSAARHGKPRPPPAESAVMGLEPWPSRSTMRQASRSLLSTSGEEVSCGQHLLEAPASSAQSNTRLNVVPPPGHPAVAANAAVGLVASVEDEGSQSSKSSDTVMSVAAPVSCEGMMFAYPDTVPRKSPLKMLVTSDTSTWIRTDAVELFMSAEEASNEEVTHDQSSGYEAAFWMRLEDVSKSKCGEEVYKQDVMLDLDQMEEGSGYTIPVGVAPTRRRIVLCTATQRLLLSVLPETLMMPRDRQRTALRCV
ncbi:hypothetical protein M409DRAFT_49782 [Zasmidium cellare ATCC 36951]|uniref:Uncharacterized protein n=1 Tax=Zasmidium cellare ATCC 36951 TaxID=1080233 RepID=A0A6A6D5B0_ZASCE|nr:uncharacterized protein M409DRAFT_49782 [Zasmidium cellare ATCC 36951]KAF2173319.1 hypothetical protein M409DRAFT_49782 [Zasmidium cellare ATCC 36951]